MCILLLLNIDKYIWYIIIILALNIGMMQAVSYFLISYYWITLFTVFSLQKRSITMTVGETRYNREYFDNITYNIVKGRVFVEMILKKPLLKGWQARLDFQMRASSSKSYQSIFSTTVDVCNIVNAYKNNLFKKWYNNLLKYGNFLRQCPLTSGQYYIRNWQFDNSLVPPFLTSGSYRLEAYNFYGRFKKADEVFLMNFAADCTIHAWQMLRNEVLIKAKLIVIIKVMSVNLFSFFGVPLTDMLSTL